MTRRVCCCFPLFPLSRRAAYVGSLVVKGVLQAGGSRLRELGEGGGYLTLLVGWCMVSGWE